MTTTAEHDIALLALLQMAIPTITACTIIDTIVQANAQGCRVAVEPPHHTELFVKRVIASDYSHKKQWTDLQRTLVYGRTEVRFYKEILPRLPCMANYAPHCHIAEYNLEGLIGENTSSSASETIPQHLQSMTGIGAFLVLDSVGADFYQESPLSQTQAAKCLEAVAQLHAAAWQNVPLLETATRRMARGSYHLSTRNPKELEQIVHSWQHFMEEFGDHHMFSSPSIRNLGKRLHDMAAYVSDQLTPRPLDKYATLCHGDFKAMNVFLPHNLKHNAVMIDFASTGVGIGMSDVAMHIIHSVRPSSDDEWLVDKYLEALQRAFSPRTFAYPRETAMRHYRLACVDYVRFIMGRFWRDATEDSFRKMRLSKNTTLINRDVDAAMSWIAKVDVFLHEFEMEKKAAIDQQL